MSENIDAQNVNVEDASAQNVNVENASAQNVNVEDINVVDDSDYDDDEEGGWPDQMNGRFPDGLYGFYISDVKLRDSQQEIWQSIENYFVEWLSLKKFQKLKLKPIKKKHRHLSIYKWNMYNYRRYENFKKTIKYIKARGRINYIKSQLQIIKDQLIRMNNAPDIPDPLLNNDHRIQVYQLIDKFSEVYYSIYGVANVYYEFNTTWSKASDNMSRSAENARYYLDYMTYHGLPFP